MEDLPPVKKAKWTFAVFYNVLLDFILFLYFAALGGFFANPAFVFILQKGVPPDAKVREPLLAVFKLAGVLFLVSLLFYETMKKVWRMRMTGAIFQAFLCGILMAAGYPWGAALAVPALLLMEIDLIRRVGIYANGMRQTFLALGLAAGLLAAFALRSLHLTWMFDFPGGVRELLKKTSAAAAPAPAQEKPNPRMLSAHRPPPAVKKTAANPVKAGISTHALILQSGKRLEGSAFREGNGGYYLTLEGMGETYFSKNEIASVEVLQN